MKNVYIPNLGEDKKIEDKFLPDYVDDVVEFATESDLPLKGVSGKLYIIRDTNGIYRWNADENEYTLIVSKDEISQLSSQIVNKIDIPETVGTVGQVLTLDENLNPMWADASGGMPDDFATTSFPTEVNNGE